MHSPVRWNNKWYRKLSELGEERRGDITWPVAQGWLHNGKELYLVTKNELSTENGGGEGVRGKDFQWKNKEGLGNKGPFIRLITVRMSPPPKKRWQRWKIEKVENTKLAINWLWGRGKEQQKETHFKSRSLRMWQNVKQKWIISVGADISFKSHKSPCFYVIYNLKKTNCPITAHLKIKLLMLNMLQGIFRI